MQRILNPGLLFLQLGLTSGPDVDLRDAAGQLGEALLELFAVVVRVGGVDLLSDLTDPGLDVLGRPRAFDDGAGVGADFDLLGLAELLDRELVQLDPDVLHDGLGAGENSDILEHRLASVAIARRFDRRHLKHTAQLVDHQRAQRFARHILSDDEQRLLGVHHLFEEGHELGHRVDLLLENEDQRLLQLDGHLVGVGDEVRAEVPTIELHALDDLHIGVETLAFFDGDHAVLADLAERLSHDLADALIVIGRDSSDRGNVVGDRRGHRLDLGDDRLDGFLHAAHQSVGLHARRHPPQPGLEECLSEDGGSGGAVAGIVGGLGGRLLDELRPHVLSPVAELDLLGHSHAILGDGGSAPGLVEHGVSPAWAERGFHRG